METELIEALNRMAAAMEKQAEATQNLADAYYYCNSPEEGEEIEMGQSLSDRVGRQ